MTTNQSKHSPKPGIKDRILRFLGLKTEPEKRSSSNRTSPRKKTARQPEDTPVTSGRLFVGNLSYSVKESDLRELFETAGKVEHAEIVTHRGSERSKGFGFVTMATLEDAKRAASQLSGNVVEGREISVNGAKSEGRRKSNSENRSDSGPRKPSQRSGSDRDRKPRERDRERKPREREERGGRSRERDSGPRSGRGGGRNQRDRKPSGSDIKVKPMDIAVVTTQNLLIKNLSEDFGEDELGDLFAGVAEVSSNDIQGGVAKVEMASVADAQEAVRLLHAKDFMGKTLEVVEESPSDAPRNAETDSDSDDE